MLRSQKGGKKTTNFDAMRDLNGRRIRHVKAVERIKEWLEKKKRDDELVNLLTGEGPELPKPTPESESLDPEFLRRLKRAAESRPAVVNEGLKHLLAEEEAAQAELTQEEPAKRLKVDSSKATSSDDSVDWLGALDALGELSSPDGEEEEKGHESSAATAGSASSSSGPSSASSQKDEKSGVAAKEPKAGTKPVAPKAEATPRPAAAQAAPRHVTPKAAAAKVAAPEQAAAAPKAAAAPPKLITVQDLRKYSSAEELLQKVTAEDLKHSLQKLGLKCGGRPEERAKRLFTLKDTDLKDLPKSFLAAPAKESKD